jgi:hypothetical protein
MEAVVEESHEFMAKIEKALEDVMQIRESI